jgi:hypothetical protein
MIGWLKNGKGLNQNTKDENCICKTEVLVMTIAAYFLKEGKEDGKIRGGNNKKQLNEKLD